MLTRPWRRLLLALSVFLFCAILLVVTYQKSPRRKTLYEYITKSSWKHTDAEKGVVNEINVDILVKTRQVDQRDPYNPTTGTNELFSGEKENGENEIQIAEEKRTRAQDNEEFMENFRLPKEKSPIRIKTIRAPARYTNRIPSEEPKNKDYQLKLNEQTTRVSPKKVVFIVGPGRTGTTLLGELFNSQDDYLYFFEPLRVVMEYNKFDYFVETDLEKTRFYAKEVLEFLLDISTCKFRPRNDHYLEQYNSTTFHSLRRKSKKMSSGFPMCDGSNCLPLNHTTMNRLCRETNNLKVVVKELSFRMPYARISSLELLQLPENFEILLLHSMRDPRAFLYSKHKLWWFWDYHKNPNKHLAPYVQESCSLIQKNINHFKGKRTETRVKYKLFRYEDLLLQNLTLFGDSVERFLGFESKNINVADYFYNKTRRPSSNFHDITFGTTSRNITIIINKWRMKMDFGFVELIQRSCAGVMRELGYSRVTSLQHQRNISLSLVKAPSIKLATFY